MKEHDCGTVHVNQGPWNMATGSKSEETGVRRGVRGLARREGMT